MDPWPLSRAEPFDNLRGNLDTRRGLTAKLDGGAKFQGVSPVPASGYLNR
jgi:hypothetical protein